MDYNQDKSALYLELSKVRFTQFNKRRDFEFKLNISVWTVLAIIIGFLYQHGTPGDVGTKEIIVVSGLVGVFILYAFWMFYIHKENQTDKSLAFLSAERAERFQEIREKDLIFRPSPLPASNTDFNKDYWGNKKYFILQILITLVLATVGAVLAVL